MPRRLVRNTAHMLLFSPHSLAARTHSHALRITLRPDRHSCITRVTRTHQACVLFFVYRFFFVAIISACARFALVSTTLNTLHHDHRINEHTRTHRICASRPSAYGCGLLTDHRNPVVVSA